MIQNHHLKNFLNQKRKKNIKYIFYRSPSLLKLHALKEHSKKLYGKRKLEQLLENVKQKIEKILEVELRMDENESEKIMQQEAADVDKHIEIMKKQLQLM